MNLQMSSSLQLGCQRLLPLRVDLVLFVILIKNHFEDLWVQISEGGLDSR